MAENSNIEWTHHTFNPWIGCQKVGPGCDHCYAETWDARGLQQRESRWGAHAVRTRTSAANWRKPLAWDRAAAAVGERQRVFCASLADVFDNHASILPEWRADLWALIAATPNLDWMLLSKRPGNIANMLPVPFGFEKQYPNVWLGCTVVNQVEADRDIPKLLAAPAVVRFLSMEPLLGPVDLLITDRRGHEIHALRGIACDPTDCEGPDEYYRTGKINLVIVGGESGKDARPMHPDWARSLRDQCVAAGVAFHFKQWGEWVSALQIEGATGISAALARSGHWAHPHRYRIHGGALDGNCYESLPEHHEIMRIGKHDAGRLLDGRTWDGMPVPEARP